MLNDRKTSRESQFKQHWGQQAGVDRQVFRAEDRQQEVTPLSNKNTAPVSTELNRKILQNLEVVEALRSYRPSGR